MATTTTHHEPPLLDHRRSRQDASHPVAAWGRRETELERADRNLHELVQEVRVVQTGVQVLFGFLLTVPFTVRFADVTSFQRTLYFAALLMAGTSAVLLIAPASQHRIVFRRDDKRHLLQMAHRYAIAGMAVLGATMTVSVALVTDVLYGRPLTLIASLVTGGGLALFWYGLPLSRRRTIGSCDS